MTAEPEQGPPPPTEWQKQLWKEGERHHDELLKREEIHSRQVDSFSVLGMRSLGLIAGAGIAASLGFYSANFDRLKVQPAALAALNGTLACFFVALLLMLVAILAAYFSQALFAESLATRLRTWEFPYEKDTTTSVRSGLIGRIARWVAVGSSIASAIAIFVGGFILLSIVH